MADTGLGRGLSVDLQFNDRINDLRYNEQANLRAKAVAEQKAALFAQDLDYQNSINSYDNPLIKQAAQNQIKKIGAFVRENPDWATNVDKRIQLNNLKRELKDNSDLHRGLASDAAYKEYLKDMQEVAKNPQQHDTQAYNSVNQEWQNYLKYGNQGGEEAAAKEGKQAFLYNKPRDFIDINKAFQETGNTFKDLKTKPIKGGRNAYEEYADPNSLRAVATQMYSQNQRQIYLEARKRGIDPLSYIEQGINAHIAKKRDFGDYGLSDALTVASVKDRLKNSGVDNPSNAYQDAFVNRQEGVVSPEFLEQTYGSKPKAIIYNNKGQEPIDITGNRVYYTGAHKYVEAGGRKQKLVETYTYLPLDVAKEKGIYEDPFFGSEEIVPEWNKQAEIITQPNNKGEDVKVVKVKSLMPVELNSSYAGAFNQQAHIAKSKLMADAPQETSGNSGLGEIKTNNATGKSYRKVEGGWQEIN